MPEPTPMTNTAGIPAHPHALKALIQASEQYAIVASQDIVDVAGMNLWGRGQPVSQSLATRLLARRLAKPLESCLVATNGITLFTLRRQLQEVLEEDGPVNLVCEGHATLLLQEVEQLPLHSVAQLLLSAVHANRPHTLKHAVVSMALAGALAATLGDTVHPIRTAAIRMSMLAGLMHDIGEIYVPPQHLDYSGPMGVEGHKLLMVHPRLAQLVLDGTTDYPKALTRAIGEHHERLDGSGYPARVRGSQLSALGRILSVVEVASAVLRMPDAPLTRASFALRVVPGEFDVACTALICDVARTTTEAIPERDPAASELSTQSEIDVYQDRARELAGVLKQQRCSDVVVNIAEEAAQRLDRLRVAWNALGLWALPRDELLPREWFDLTLAERELMQRLHGLQRECLLLSDKLRDSEKAMLEPLWQGLLDEQA
jgi:HD domain